MTMTYMHINYFEAGYCLEDAFRLAKEIGYDGIELRDRDRSGELALKDYLQLTDKLRKQFQLSVIYGCRLDTTHRDAVVRNQSLDDCLEVIRFAGEMGVETLNLFAGSLIGEQPMLFSQQGSALADESVYQQAAPMLKQVAAVAREYGMTLCLETHNGYMHDLAKPAAELVDRLGDPNLKVNFDFGNILLNRNGETLDDAIQILGSRIGYVHLKNLKVVPGGEEGDFFVTDLCSGDINNYFLVQSLKASGYDGVFCIENTMKGDRYPAAINDLAYFQTISQRCRDNS